MGIEKILAIGIVGTFLAVTVRSYRAELGMAIAAATGIVIFAAVIPEINAALTALSELCELGGINAEYFKAVVKIIGIAYIAQFASELAKDAGEGAVARKIEFAGKISVLAVMMPAVKNLLETVIGTLMSF